MHGRWLPISTESSLALKTWLDRSGIKSGVIFRGVNRGNKLTKGLDPGQIGRIYKRIARNAQIDEALVQHISSHSIRVGAAQDLLLSGASLPIVMTKGRWTKSDTVMRYVEKVGIPV